MFFSKSKNKIKGGKYDVNRTQELSNAAQPIVSHSNFTFLLKKMKSWFYSARKLPRTGLMNPFGTGSTSNTFYSIGKFRIECDSAVSLIGYRAECFLQPLRARKILYISLSSRRVMSRVSAS